MKKAVTGLGFLIALTPLTSSYANEDAGVYIGARAGVSELTDACVSGSCDDREAGAGLILGYDFTKWIALEGTYDYLGEFDTSFTNNGTTTTANGDLTAFTLAPKLNIPVTDTTDIYGKLGAAWWDWDSSAGDNDDVSLLGAVGIDHRATDLVNLRLEYQYIDDLDKGYFNGANSHFLSAGVTFHFGRTSAPPPAPVVEEPVMVKEEPKSFVLSEAGDVELFAFGKSELSAGAAGQLQPMVERLVNHEESTVVITGHTDSVGPAEFNQKLSEQRAQTVANYFINRGIDSDRITVEGRGESDPIASNETDEGRMKNRRVEIESPEFVFVEDKM